MADSSDQLMYLCGGEIDAGEFSLRITADDLEPDQVTRLLGRQPTDAHRRGDSFGKRGGTYNFGQWTFSTGRLDFRADRSCEEAFDGFVRSLPDAPTLSEHLPNKNPRVNASRPNHRAALDAGGAFRYSLGVSGPREYTGRSA